MMEQWQVRLRVLQALDLEVSNVSLDVELPPIHARQGKGRKARIVLVHPELHATLTSTLQFDKGFLYIQS